MITYIEQGPLPSSLSLSAPATDETDDSSSWCCPRRRGGGAIDRRNRRRIEGVSAICKRGRLRILSGKNLSEEFFERFFFYDPSASFTKEIFVRMSLTSFVFFSNYSVFYFEGERFQLIRLPNDLNKL